MEKEEEKGRKRGGKIKRRGEDWREAAKGDDGKGQ